MEIHELRYFLALTKTRNFTRAAEKCHVTQPSLTRAIKNLEMKLDAGSLIDRRSGNSQLTELGKIMVPYFENVINALEGAKSKAREHSAALEATLKVGLMSTIGPRRLVDLFIEFGKSHPGVDIYLMDGPVNEIEDKLERGELDVAVYARPVALESRFHTVSLFEERFMVVLPPSDPLSLQPAINMSDLNQKRYLGRADCEFYQELRRIRLEKGGIEFKRRYNSNRDDWIQSMVMAGLGFTYLPEFAVAMPDLVARPLVDPEVWRTVQLVTVRGRPHAPSVGAFVCEARRFAWRGKVEQNLEHASDPAEE